MTAIRHPAVAGTFYPAEPDALERQLALFLSEAAQRRALARAAEGDHRPACRLRLFRRRSRRAPMRASPRRAGKISRVVLIGPSHYVGFRGLAVDTAEAWAMPGGTVALDTEAIARLRALPMVGELDAAYQREHALEVHVPFLQHVLGEFRLVPIVAGDAPPEAVAAVFDALWGGPETLIVVSTDLSHYLDYAACRRLDQSTAEAIERFDIDALGPDRGVRAGADARAAAGGAAARHDDRAARSAQLRRYRRAARPGGGLRRLGALRGRAAGCRARGGRGGRADADRPGAPVDRVRAGHRPAAACGDRRRAGAAAGRARRRLRHAAPPTARCAAASARRWRRGR